MLGSIKNIINKKGEYLFMQGLKKSFARFSTLFFALFLLLVLPLFGACNENNNNDTDNSTGTNTGQETENKTKEMVTITVEQYCGDTKDDYAVITGAGSYEKGTEVVLHVESVQDEYYFVNWNEEQNDGDYSFTASEDVTIKANFEEWKIYPTFYGHRIKVEASASIRSETYLGKNSLVISVPYSDAFSYWDMNGSIYSSDEIFRLTDSNTTQDMAFRAHYTNCGVFAIAGYTSANKCDFENLFTGTLANLTEVKNFVNNGDNAETTKYSFAIDNYQVTTTDDFSSYIDSNITANSISGTSVTYLVAVPSSYSYYCVFVGKIFYDDQGVLKLGMSTGTSGSRSYLMSTNLKETVEIADSFDDKNTHLTSMSISLTPTK